MQLLIPCLVEVHGAVERGAETDPCGSGFPSVDHRHRHHFGGVAAAVAEREDRRTRERGAARGRLAVEQATCRDDRHAMADGIDDLWHERHRRHLPGVTAGLGALRDDDVASRLDGCGRVAHLAAHARDEDVVRVTQIDHVARHTEAGDEDASAAVDHRLHLRLDLPRDRGEEVDPERLRRERTGLRDLVDHHLVTHRRRAEASETSGFRDGGREAVIGDAAHPGEHHGVFDFQHVGEAGAHEPASYEAGHAARPVTSPGGRER